MRLSRDFLANELQSQFEKLSNQVRFVKMIVGKELVVSNRNKADIVEDLPQKKFRPFLKVTKAKTQEKPRMPKTVPTMRPMRRPRVACQQITITFGHGDLESHERDSTPCPCFDSYMISY